MPAQASLLPEALLAAVSRAAGTGAVWLVGGALRDFLLGRPRQEFDFAVQGDARKMARRVANALNGAYFQLDDEFDAGRVVFKSDQGLTTPLDFAALRAPTIEADLQARDFTINALAAPLEDLSQLIDPTGGLADLKARRIRICSPGAIEADPIRSLRAIRQALQLDFRIESQTQAAIRQAPTWLARVSAERIRDEVFRLLESRHPASGMRLLDHFDLLIAILPELGPLHQIPLTAGPSSATVFEHTLAVIDHLSTLLEVLAEDYDSQRPGNSVLAEASLMLGRFRPSLKVHMRRQISAGRSLRSVLYLAALYHDVGKGSLEVGSSPAEPAMHEHAPIGAELVEKRCLALRLSVAESRRARTIVKGHSRLKRLEESLPLDRRFIYRFFRDFGEAGIDIIVLSLADLLAKVVPAPPPDHWTRRLELARQLMQAYYEQQSEVVDPPALINGNDLISVFELSPGPEIGDLLEQIREAQAAGDLSDRQAALAWVHRALHGGPSA